MDSIPSFSLGHVLINHSVYKPLNAELTTVSIGLKEKNWLRQDKKLDLFASTEKFKTKMTHLAPPYLPNQKLFLNRSSLPATKYKKGWAILLSLTVKYVGIV